MKLTAPAAAPEVTPTKANGNDVDEMESQPNNQPPYPPLGCNGRNAKGHDANGIFDIAMLTCGATRSYGNKHKGNQAAFVVTSGVSNSLCCN